jgi:hypothetical protein
VVAIQDDANVGRQRFRSRIREAWRMRQTADR